MKIVQRLASYFQIIAEFQRILGVKSNVKEVFQQGFRRVAEPILTIAKSKKGKLVEEVKGILKALDGDGFEEEEEEEDNSLG